MAPTYLTTLAVVLGLTQCGKAEGPAQPVATDSRRASTVAPATALTPAQTPQAQPPQAQPPQAQPKPARAAKPTKRAANDDPVIYGNGVKWSKSRMNDVDDFESNKDSWDHGSIRKSRGNMSYGQITTAYRCDDRDGCGDKNRGWSAIGYFLEPW